MLKEKQMKMKEKNLKKIALKKDVDEKGITLIALIITIIVLIILAAITLLALTGNNGLFTRATEAKENTEISDEKEAIKIAYSGVLIENKGEGVTSSELETELHNNGRKDASVTGENPMIITYESGRNYMIDENGNVTEAKPPEQEISEIEGVTIPEGFFYVGGVKADGIVISDQKADELKYKELTDSGTTQIPTEGLIGNQFVWVPVENIEEFKTYYTNKNNDNFYEPAIPGYRYENEEEEFNKMKQSVEKNKGFYVARYEAGQEDDKVVSKSGVMPYSVQWGQSMTEIGTEGAVAKAKNMYTNKSLYKVTSTLIYGTQWDAIMSWIDPAYKTESCDESSIVMNSETIGNYSNQKQQCGSSDNYRIKNIYDLAGNMSEWTMEQLDDVDYGENQRTCRDTKNSMSARIEGDNGLVFKNYGFRVTLYID